MGSVPIGLTMHKHGALAKGNQSNKVGLPRNQQRMQASWWIGRSQRGVSKIESLRLSKEVLADRLFTYSEIQPQAVSRKPKRGPLLLRTGLLLFSLVFRPTGFVCYFLRITVPSQGLDPLKYIILCFDRSQISWSKKKSPYKICYST